jgi:hypothetical protein
MIYENAPLSGYPFTAVFPIFKPFTKCCGSSDVADDGRREPLIEQKGGIKKKKTMTAATEQEKKEDPYLQLGFGMIAYRDMLFTLILLFSLLSIIMAPAYFFFSGGSQPGIMKNI